MHSSLKYIHHLSVNQITDLFFDLSRLSVGHIPKTYHEENIIHLFYMLEFNVIWEHLIKKYKIKSLI